MRTCSPVLDFTLGATDTFHTVSRFNTQLHWETCLFSDCRLGQNSLTRLTSWSMAGSDFPSPIGLSWDRKEITMSCRLSGQMAHTTSLCIQLYLQNFALLSFLPLTSWSWLLVGQHCCKNKCWKYWEISKDYHRKREKRGHIDLEAARGRKQWFLLPAWSLSDLPAPSIPPLYSHLHWVRVRSRGRPKWGK